MPLISVYNFLMNQTMIRSTICAKSLRAFLLEHRMKIVTDNHTHLYAGSERRDFILFFASTFSFSLQKYHVFFKNKI